MPISAVVAVGLVSEEGTPKDFNEIWLIGVVGEKVDTPVVGLAADGEREVPIVVKRGFSRLSERHYSIAREMKYKIVCILDYYLATHTILPDSPVIR